MRAYLDLWTGLSGDMMVGAILDAGWPEDAMRATLAALPLPEVRVEVEWRAQEAVRGRGIRVLATQEPPHRSFVEVRRLLMDSSLRPSVRDRSIAMFERLAGVEGEIHGVAPENVHFHELGAIDSIADIVLATAGLEDLGVRELACGAIPLSRGEVRGAHGVLPAPAPATLRLLEGLPIRWLPIEGEWLTPTGALLLSGLVTSFADPPPSMRLVRVGTGAGTRRTPGRANIVRLLIGEDAAGGPDPSEGGESLGWISVLETDLDDIDPRQAAEVAERLAQEGALEVLRTPVQMKKGRSGIVMTVLCRPELEEKLGSILLSETTTLGIRVRREHRRELARWSATVGTPYGPVGVKWSRPGGRLRAVPEFEDVRRRAREAGVPAWEVERAAVRAAEDLQKDPSKVPDPPPIP